LTEAGISWYVGGIRWKVLFLDRQAYFVTPDGSGPGANQFNLQGRHWVDFRPGKKSPTTAGDAIRLDTPPKGTKPEGPSASSRQTVSIGKFTINSS